MKLLYCQVLALFLIVFGVCVGKESTTEYVTVAILAKDKAHVLPLYLSCIERQTWPSEKIYLYIRTNNNNDATATVLRDWVDRVGKNYAGIFFDDTDVDARVEMFKQHEWNYTRFKVLGDIRQASVDWAKEHNSHYFVADCDNFIFQDTIESLMATNLSIVAPFLKCTENVYYSNYHSAIDVNGYYEGSPFYYNVLYQEIKGLIEVPVVHCTYLVRNEVLDKISYDDESARYEYVIFSDCARKNNIAQYIDNRKVYGYVTFTETEEDFNKVPWRNEFLVS